MHQAPGASRLSRCEPQSTGPLPILQLLLLQALVSETLEPHLPAQAQVWATADLQPQAQMLALGQRCRSWGASQGLQCC